MTETTTTSHDTGVATVKLVIAWIGTFFGSVTLNHLVLGATLIFTCLQIYVLIRKIRKGDA